MGGVASYVARGVRRGGTWCSLSAMASSGWFPRDGDGRTWRAGRAGALEGRGKARTEATRVPEADSYIGREACAIVPICTSIRLNGYLLGRDTPQISSPTAVVTRHGRT